MAHSGGGKGFGILAKWFFFLAGPFIIKSCDINHTQKRVF